MTPVKPCTGNQHKLGVDTTGALTSCGATVLSLQCLWHKHCNVRIRKNHKQNMLVVFSQSTEGSGGLKLSNSGHCHHPTKSLWILYFTIYGYYTLKCHLMLYCVWSEIPNFWFIPDSTESVYWLPIFGVLLSHQRRVQKGSTNLKSTLCNTNL